MKLNKYIILIVVGALSLAASCKKEPKPEPKPEPPKPTRADLSKDSIFYYAKEMYLWSDALPTYDVFKPRSYTSQSSDLLNYEKELIALTQYKINPVTGKPYEYFSNGTDSKYSYISDLADKNPVAFVQHAVSAVDLEGNGNDFGIKLGAYYLDNTQKPFALFVTAVYPNSPADKAGMIRSYRIDSINARAIGENFSTDRDFINNAMDGVVIRLVGNKYVNGTKGDRFTIDLLKKSYSSSPVYANKVLTAGSKKIGYLAYARFSRMANSKPDLDLAFADFNSKGVTDLIIDLRYNGGGYINTAQYLINLIAPISVNGSVMFAEHYNPLMQSGGAKILENQPLLDANGKVQFQNGRMITYKDVDFSLAGNTERFLKQGSFNTTNTINNVVFIVSSGTASASELLINSLKPHMNVKIVGAKTYGKPVGFFPIRIENKYEVFYSLFITKNSLGEGDYFDGIIPDLLDTYDDPLYNFGDEKENYLAKAVNLIAPNTITTGVIANKTMSISGKSVPVKNLGKMFPVVSGNEFVGMIENKHTLKK